MGRDSMEYTGDTIAAMLIFSLCSSSLLLVNKICMHMVAAPSFISTIQFFTAGAFALILKGTGLAVVDDFEWTKVKPYLLYVAMFVATIYCNMKSLEHSNVETIIVFRACCPLCVCLLDWCFLGRELPSRGSLGSLLVLLAGAAGYVASDREFKMQGFAAYSWVSAYFCIISVEMAYGKYIVGPHLGLKSMWGPTMYTNVLSIPPMALTGFFSHEELRLGALSWTAGLVTMLVISCIIGVAISYTGWKCRSMITATCYTVLGVANKMATVLANCLIWDKHASFVGIVCLCVCLLGAASYKQAPMRAESAAAPSLKSFGAKNACGLVLLIVVGLSFGLGAGAGAVGLATPKNGPLLAGGGGFPGGPGGGTRGGDAIETFEKERRMRRRPPPPPHRRHFDGKHKGHGGVVFNRTVLEGPRGRGSIACNSTVRGDSSPELCDAGCKAAKSSSHCKFCSCSACSWCKK